MGGIRLTRYSLRTSTRFEREFRKLDKYTRTLIMAWLIKNLKDCTDPRAHGKALKGKYAGLWRYRIGDYRVICKIEDEELIIIALEVGHRKQIYDQEI